VNILTYMWEPVNLELKYWTYVREEGPSRLELHQNPIFLYMKQNIHM